MIKELLALDELKHRNFYYSKDGIDISTFVHMRLDIIETALKRLEQAENCVFTSKEDIKTVLKALEIIKEKMVDIFVLSISENVEMYNNKRSFRLKLTQEEFDLLKGVF